MGELHLDIYVERMKREYGVECKVRGGSVVRKINNLPSYFFSVHYSHSAHAHTATPAPLYVHTLSYFFIFARTIFSLRDLPSVGGRAARELQGNHHHQGALQLPAQEAVGRVRAVCARHRLPGAHGGGLREG